MIGLRLGKERITALDKWAKSKDLTRSEAIRRLVELGLKSKPGK
jgi:hypothetical protein